MSALAEKLARAKHTEEYVGRRRQLMEQGSFPPIPEGDPDPDVSEDGLPQGEQVARSAGIISACVAISRITGFIRTWSMAFALGATFLSSSYQVANNLPNQLYELVMGGMLVTAFLPVYMSAKKKAGDEAGNRYASNLFTLVVLLLGVVSVLCMVFPQAIIYTQSFMTDQSEMGTAVLLFQFFAIQTVFYGASTILSGLLNANREYLWSSAAPIFNNVVVIATFIAYAVIAPTNPEAALYIIAIGNPAGVLLQVLVQVPALRRCGIRLRPRIDLKDPWLKDTLRLGASAILITVCTFITVSAMNAASYAFADNGPSVIAYARLWYTLPYSFLAIPITTAMFTELSDMHADGNMAGVMKGVQSGSCQILFLLAPFMLYLIVFATPLVTLYHTGAFAEDAIGQIAGFLAALAIALPVYGLMAYLQKVFSSIRKLGTFAFINIVASVVQVILTLGAAELFRQGSPIPIESIALASVAFYVVADLAGIGYLRIRYGGFSVLKMVKSALLGLVLGALGAAVGGAVAFGISMLLGSAQTTIWGAAIQVVCGGIVALAVTFGIALATKTEDAALIRTFMGALRRRAS
ncbi:MAG: murein biosynthesis integral membrane protein MurJ [Eggerthellaceae bacterium]|nr:murein biosynthesis integral membrane protein MurJ [Eggerthellaceae bacterium]